MEPVIAITGASGSLGKVLVERLARDPGVEKIVAVDRREPRVPGAGKVEFHRGDVRDPAIADLFRGCGAVLHLAFIVERGSRDMALAEEVNVGGSVNVAEAAARAGVGHVVYASSIAAYGFHPENEAGPLTEDAPCRGNDDFYYARHKAEVERRLDAFEAEHPEVAVARLRPSIFLGPRGNRNLAWLRRPVFPYLSGRDLPVHVTHEDDVAEAFHLALAKKARGAFNVATEEPLPMRAWPRAMGKRGVPLPPQITAVAEAAYRLRLSEVDPVWLKAGGEHPIVVSSRKIRRTLRWKPRYETTGAVLRALAGTPTRSASRGTKILFGSLATVTRLRGGLPVTAGQKRELRDLSGSANVVFTGAHPSEWHIRFDDGTPGFYRGIDPDARATALMDESVFFDVLAGDLTWSNATMTGKVRFRGEGHYGLIVSGFFGALRHVLDAREAGPARRLFSRAVLSGRPTKEAR